LTRSGISAGMLTALTASVVRPIYFVKLETPSLELNFNSSGRNITFASENYVANGNLQFIPTINETQELAATTCEIVMDGANSIQVATGLSLRQSDAAYVWLGLADSSLALISDPILLFKGYFDNCILTDEVPTPTIVLTYESELLKMNRPGTFKYMNSHQQGLFPGDLGFQYVSSMEDWRGFWGRSQNIRGMRKKRGRT